jgi:hypothetical protein
MFAVSVSRPLAAALLALSASALGACGSSAPDDGIATGTGQSAPAAETSAGPSPAADQNERARQYVACLRGQGVQVADPEAGKQVQLNEDRPQDKQAAQACRQYLPTAVTGRGADMNLLRQYATCMRQHGFPDFPDPDPDRGIQLPKSLLTDPAYKAADSECGQDLKGGGK